MNKEKEILESNGYAWKMFQTDSPLKKRTYYTRDGRAIVLPADVYSLEHYLKVGFTLVPPINPTPTEEGILPAGVSDQVEEKPVDEVRMEQAQPKKTRRKKRKYRRKIIKEE